MTAQTVTVQVRRHFNFPPERVFDAWLDPTLAGRFLFATPTGVMVKVAIDAKVGGRFEIVERRGDKDEPHVGEYLEIDRPRRLAFTFGDNIAFDATTVTVEITPAVGGCDLVLTHTGVGPQWEAQTHEGWTGILESLARALV
ncbi:SRPBCC domain-containing protein [Phenylobacterium aquaticum]|uniref:SRPBCC family protein n=1 Tax=Phenylobacterium aquaticum TaxID=1763816 RepID=UPI0026ECF5FA|nr:SRPBCC domain-containing protein [Phenylobacterium aquaticum]